MLKSSSALQCSHLQTSVLEWCFWGDVQCHLSSKHSVYYDIQRVQVWLYSDSVSQACPKVLQQTLNELQQAFSSARVLPGEYAYRPQLLRALLVIFYETIVPAESRFSWSTPQVVLGSWPIVLIIIFTPLSEILWGAPGLGQIILKPCSLDYGSWPQQCSVEHSRFRNPFV